MTTEEIEKRVADIKAMSGDSECAHGAEDKLRNDFIAYIAEMDEVYPALAGKANLVISTNDLDFERWCA